MYFRFIRTIALVISTVMLSIACKKGENASPGGDRPGNAAGPANSGGSMTDPNIFHALDATNMGDSAKGSLASTKGTSADIREFAMMMMRDHHTLRLQGQDLAMRLAIQPTPPAGDSLQAKLDEAMFRLQAAAKGRDFDKAYMDHEVAAHREALMIATSAMSTTRNSEIKNLIQKLAPIEQAHLDNAQAIQKNLQQ